MMRVKFSFPYDTRLSPEEETALNRVIVGGPIQRYDDDHSVESYRGTVQTHTTYEGDLEQIMAVLPRNLRVEVQGLADPQPLVDIAEQLGRLSRQLDRLSTRNEPHDDDHGYVNTKIDVHTPGNVLLAVNEVDYFLNYCTEELQERLDEGWRILAICPQRDQRRPDYIMGRRREQNGARRALKPDVATTAPVEGELGLPEVDAEPTPAPEVQVPADEYVPF